MRVKLHFSLKKFGITTKYPYLCNTNQKQHATMKTLEQILTETYGHKKVFKENGQPSEQGYKDLRKLETLLVDLQCLLGSHVIDSAAAIRTLDEIVNSETY